VEAGEGDTSLGIFVVMVIWHAQSIKTNKAHNSNNNFFIMTSGL
jgi:hypothetical protein